jgi:hypothetical protein
MNKKIYISALAGAVVFFVGAQAHALTVNTGVTGGVQVAAASGSAVNASGSASGSMNMDLGNGGLQAQIQAGIITQSSGEAMVGLQGNMVDMIQSNADLMAYNNLVVQARPAVTAVNVNSDNSVDVHYSQPAKFLGIFSTSLSGDVNVDAQGNTKVYLPWYAFLYSKDTTSVQTSAATAVAQSGAQFNAQADATTMVQNQARVVNAVSAAIQAQVSASATATATGSASAY